MTDLIRAYTGPTKLTENQTDWVEDVILSMPEPGEVRTGCADGVDSVAAWLEWMTWPESRHTLYIPAAYHNAKLVSALGLKDTVSEVHCAERGRGAANAYRQRNTAMIMGANKVPNVTAHVLEAFVFSPEFYRSGEWMTINIAKKQGVRINMHLIPEGL